MRAADLSRFLCDVSKARRCVCVIAFIITMLPCLAVTTKPNRIPVLIPWQNSEGRIRIGYTALRTIIQAGGYDPPQDFGIFAEIVPGSGLDVLVASQIQPTARYYLGKDTEVL